MSNILQDLRYATRMMLRAPGFTAVAIITLALGIGANTAIFSIVRSVLLQPLPYGDSDRLVQVFETWERGSRGPASPANLRDWRQQNEVFEQLAAYSLSSRNLQDVANPEHVASAEISENLLSTLQVSPLLGRGFTAAETKYGAAHTVILNEGLWRQRFNADAGILGKNITLDGEPYTVLGVMPASFHFPADDDTVQLWLPLQIAPKLAESRNSHFLPVIGRLKRGVTLAQARADMVAVAARIAAADPERGEPGRSVMLLPLRERIVGRVRAALMALLGAVGLVLLIACANLANLLLARAAGRRREVAVRAALGAGRWRLIRQFLSESILLSVVGGGVGLLLAVWGVRLLPRLAGNQLPRLYAISFDRGAFAFILLVSVSAGIIFGLVPALYSVRRDLLGGLKQSATGGSREHSRLRRVLVAAEVALSVVLLAGAGLLLKTLLHLNSTRVGLVSENVLTFHISRPEKTGNRSTTSFETSFYPRLLEKMRALPGVRAAAMINMLPIQDCWTNSAMEVQGRPPAEHVSWIETRVVSDDYFRALGIPLVRGRGFGPGDANEKHPVLLVNEALVTALFPNEDPIGRRLKGWGTTWEIVGVVKNVRQAALDFPPLPEVYGYFRQTGVWPEMTMVVSSPLPPDTLVPMLRDAVRQVDPNQPIYGVQSMRQVISESIADRRMYLELLAAFALVGMAVACTGIYGVISYIVAQRTPEFGLRLALGASHGNLLRLILREGAVLVLAGVLVGLAGAFGVTRLIAAYLYGTRPTDPSIFVTVALVLSGVGLLASYVAARRTANLEPMEALRYE